MTRSVLGLIDDLDRLAFRLLGRRFDLVLHAANLLFCLACSTVDFPLGFQLLVASEGSDYLFDLAL